MTKDVERFLERRIERDKDKTEEFRMILTMSLNGELKHHLCDGKTCDCWNDLEEEFLNERKKEEDDLIFGDVTEVVEISLILMMKRK